MVFTPQIDIFNAFDGAFNACGIDILNADGLTVKYISVHLKIIGRGESVDRSAGGGIAVVGAAGETENETVYFTGDNFAAPHRHIIKDGGKCTRHAGKEVGEHQNTTSAGQREPYMLSRTAAAYGEITSLELVRELPSEYSAE